MIPQSQTINVTLQDGYESRYVFQAEETEPLPGVIAKVEEVAEAQVPPSKAEKIPENEILLGAEISNNE